MNNDGWRKVREVFDAALRQPSENRLNYARQACGDDQDLLREVESLLSSLDSSDSFMEKPAVVHVVDVIEPAGKGLQPGSRFGHYEIIRELGIGGMGRVYLAKDEKLDRRVAIKILNEEVSRRESSLQRFVREAKAASALNHPNILVIHEIGEADNTSYIVSEFIEGRTLREILVERSLDLTDVLDISIQVANALTAAHAIHLVHRDIKPENIMIRPDGYVKVLDFSLAKLVEKKQQSFLGLEVSTVRRNQTAKGVILGTVKYMSPEQAKGEPIDERTDIFSFGVVIYEMVAGRTPFAQDSMSETLANLINAEPQPLSRFAVTVPDELNRIVSKMLRKNRDERYQTIKDVLTDLKDLRTDMTLEKKLAGPRLSGGDKATAVLAPPVRDTNQQIDKTRDSVSQRIARHKPVVGVVLVTLLAIAIGLAYYFVYSRTPTGDPDSKVTAGLPLKPSFKSLAVLPLDNFSGDSAQDYLADGMTEALITELSKIGSLRVISRQSVMQYKAARKPLPEIARELNVDVIVTGSVQLSGDKIGITAQLIRAATDQHLWANQYERQVRDVISLQREVARTIAAEVDVKLTPQEQGLLADARSINPQAHEAYLNGLYWLNKGIDESRTDDIELFQKSLHHFEQALKLDPDYALAYSGSSRSYHFLATGGLPQYYSKAKEAALKALSLDQNLADAHGALAYTIWRYEWDFGEAEKEFKKAVELAPGASHWGYAQFLSTLGRHDEAIRLFRVAQDVDPRTVSLKLSAGVAYINARQYEQAIAQFRTVVELDPKRFETHSGLCAAYTLRGMHEEGIAECKRALDLSGDMSERVDLAWAYAIASRRNDAIKILDDLKHPSKRNSVGHRDLAQIYSALGEKDLAMAQLEMAYSKRQGLLWLKVDPSFDGLRYDPRFTEMLRRIGFPP